MSAGFSGAHRYSEPASSLLKCSCPAGSYNPGSVHEGYCAITQAMKRGEDVTKISRSAEGPTTAAREEADAITLIRAEIAQDSALSAWKIADHVYKDGRTGLSMTTLIYHTQEVMREVWVEQGIDTSSLISQMLDTGEVAVPRGLAPEIRRLLDGANIGYRELVTFRKIER